MRARFQRFDGRFISNRTRHNDDGQIKPETGDLLQGCRGVEPRQSPVCQDQIPSRFAQRGSQAVGRIDATRVRLVAARAQGVLDQCGVGFVILDMDV